MRQEANIRAEQLKKDIELKTKSNEEQAKKLKEEEDKRRQVEQENADLKLRVEAKKHILPGATAQASASPVVVSGSDAFAQLRLCEAGGDYTKNTGNGYYGAYQYDLSTWAGFGGYTYPNQAPPAVQDLKAQLTKAARGWSPWPACARKLGLL